MVKPIHPDVVELNSRIFAARLDLNRVLRRAKVSRSTWWRWVRFGRKPQSVTRARIDTAIDELSQQKEANLGQTGQRT